MNLTLPEINSIHKETDDLIDNEIPDNEIMKSSKYFKLNNSETVTKKYDKEKPK